MSALDFRVLGPVEVINGGSPLVTGRGKALDVLATLLASPNQAISLDTPASASATSMTTGHPAVVHGLAETGVEAGKGRMADAGHGYLTR
ncbi:MAG: hypothetical protein LBI49_01040, partial [Nocardiopsaceae bacterium]|nr:hypothetical protein [Nocardiopsaceae bacterium]